MNQQSINNEQVMQRWIDYAHSTGYEGVSAIDVVAWAICELKAMREIEGEIKAGNGIDQEMIDVILGLMSEHDIRWDSIDIEFE